MKRKPGYLRLILGAVLVFVGMAGKLYAASVIDEFNPNANDSVRSLAVQADGKILLGGYFTSLGGATRNRIARLNPDGTLDSTFDPNANSVVYSLAVQADGKILVGGYFTSLV
jgi:uncharacterized delta-60 repeat protein